jgi:hypothetical protein
MIRIKKFVYFVGMDSGAAPPRKLMRDDPFDPDGVGDAGKGWGVGGRQIEPETGTFPKARHEVSFRWQRLNVPTGANRSRSFGASVILRTRGENETITDFRTTKFSSYAAVQHDELYRKTEAFPTLAVKLKIAGAHKTNEFGNCTKGLITLKWLTLTIDPFTGQTAQR